MLFALYVLVVLLSVSSAKAVENLDVYCSLQDGSYYVLLDGKLWFRSGPLGIRQGGHWWATDHAGEYSLNLTGPGSTIQDSDVFGTFTETDFTWKAGPYPSLLATTSIRVYDEIPVVVFTITYMTGAKNTSIPNVNDRSISSFPSFVLEDGEVERGYLTWSGNMARHIKTGKWSPFTGVYGNVDGGFPLVVFDSSMENTVVLSPMNTFMSAMQNTFTDDVTKEKVLTFGPISTVTEIPVAYEFSTILVAGQNVTGTMQRFGELLRTVYQKDDSYRKADFTINYLGYWTDHGACYYYNSGNYSNYEELLIAVKEDADKMGLPYRYLQIDSWWYFEGSDGGVKNWTAMPDIFPNGIDAVVKETGWPIVAHNRWWSPQTDYAKQNGGKFDFIIDEQGALPMDPTFWDFLLSSSQLQWDLWVYEQDWLFVQYGKIPALQTDLNLGRTWLKQMGDAAQRYGLTIQYCMPWTRHLLQSVEIPVVTQTRASEDYAIDSDQWKVGITTILMHALGLAAFKDTFHTTVMEPGCNKKEYEDAPALETYAAALSGGPVGPSDHIQLANKTLILGTCMTDGRLLKPTRPAMSLDSTFLQMVFGSGGPDGQLWAAYTEVDRLTWYHIIAAELNSDYALMPAELPPSRSTHPRTFFPESVAFQHTLDGTVHNLVSFTDGGKLTISKCGKTDFQSWNIAPVMKNGWALLGELNKIIPVSETRFEMVGDVGTNGGEVVIRGVPGETVMLSLYTAGSSVATVKCDIGPSGTAGLSIPANVCTGL